MKEKINLKKIKEKDIVYFRCGGKAIVEFVDKGKYESNGGAGIGVDQIFETRRLIFEDALITVEYTLEGRPTALSPYVDTVLDIIKVEPFVQTYLTWYQVNDLGEFIQKKAINYPENSSFKFISGLFTIIDDNAKKKMEGLL